MKIRKLSKQIQILAAAALSVWCLSVPERLQAGKTKEELQSSINEKTGAIDSANQEKASLQAGLTDIRKMVKELQSVKSNLSEYVTRLDQQLAGIEKKIEELKDKIEKKNEEIKKTEQELEKAIAEEEAQYEAMKKRVKFMYERGQSMYMELLFTSSGLGDILNRAFYIEEIAAYDRKKLIEFQEIHRKVEEYKEELEAEKIVLNASKEAVEKEEKSLNILIAEKEKEIGAYQADIGDKEAQIREYEQQIAQQNATIAALEAAVKAEREALAAANQPPKQTYDGGKFKWPAPSYTRISDDFGNRMHPVLGVVKFHNGLDLAAPSGSPILAAYNGTVVAAAYNASMGNYVMIDHGDNLYTIYMHASSLGVSKGQTVSKGDRIASIGSTGRSTGPHLHFGIRLNGGYVSPWNYLSK